MGAARFAARNGDSRRQQSDADLISRLRELPAGPVLDSRFTSELRSQLVAIAPRIIAESEVPASTARSPGRSGLLRGARRPLLAFSGAAAVLVMLLGLAVWQSHGALPGQSLYGVKRASENFQLSMASGDTAKGKAYLQQATSRAKEANQLASGTSGTPAPLSPHTSSLLISTLASADTDTRSGMQLLGRAAVGQLSADPIAGLSGWATGQHAQLTELLGRLPAGTARSHTESSLALLQRVATRAAQLKGQMGCPCLSLAHSDDLGPLPCTPCASKPAGLPPVPGLPVLPTGSLPGSGTSSAAGPVPQPSLSLPGLGGAPTAIPSSIPPAGSSLPSLPSSPVSAGTGGISATLPGGISVSAGPGGVAVQVSPPPLP